MAATAVIDGLNQVPYSASPFEMLPQPGKFLLPDELVAPQRWIVGKSGSGWGYILAADWSNPDFYESAKEPHQPPQAGDVMGGVACWQPVFGTTEGTYPADYALAGDVIATTEHVGIVVAPGATASAAVRNTPLHWPGTVVLNNWGFRLSDPHNSGLKADAGVKRFQCF
jgi:hypothetical protein